MTDSDQQDPLAALEKLLDETKKQQGHSENSQAAAQSDAETQSMQEEQKRREIEAQKQLQQQQDREQIQQKLQQIRQSKDDPHFQTDWANRNKRERIANQYQIRQLQHTKIEVAQEQESDQKGS